MFAVTIAVHISRSHSAVAELLDPLLTHTQDGLMDARMQTRKLFFYDLSDFERHHGWHIVPPGLETLIFIAEDLVFFPQHLDLSPAVKELLLLGGHLRCKF